jgi:hypothetical protein
MLSMSILEKCEMEKHNDLVETNNFLLRHLNMTWKEYNNLPTQKTFVCEKHLKENCDKCKK